MRRGATVLALPAVLALGLSTPARADDACPSRSAEIVLDVCVPQRVAGAFCQSEGLDAIGSCDFDASVANACEQFPSMPLTVGGHAFSLTGLLSVAQGGFDGAMLAFSTTASGEG